MIQVLLKQGKIVSFYPEGLRREQFNNYHQNSLYTVSKIKWTIWKCISSHSKTKVMQTLALINQIRELI